MNRFYHSSPIELKQKIHLSNQVAHHANHVLRLKTEDKIILFHNDPYDYSAVITQINKKTVEVYIDSKFENQKNPTIHLRLFQSLSSSEKMDWIIQKSVELGVSSIIPMYSKRSNIKLQGSRAEKKLSHWQQVIISACEQSGRSSLPKISLPKKIEECLSLKNEKNGNHLKLILSPKEKNNLQNINNSSVKNIDIMIGPEGGFTEGELNQTIKSNFVPIGLGPRILRTETAPLSILSILQYKYGDFA